MLAVDVHVSIDPKATSDGHESWLNRLGALGEEYSYSNHVSESSLSIPSMFTLPGNFSQSTVLKLFTRLDCIRKLRK